MKIAHLADLHLGFRQYWRETAGQNAREVDVATALRRAFDDVIEQRPDAIVIAGDIMHQSKPRTAPIMLFFNQLARVRQALPDTAIVVVAGNHDVARTMEIGQAGCILPLYEHLGVHVAVHESKAIRLAGGVTITALPSPVVTQIVTPDPQADMNVLVVHGQVPSRVYPHAYAADAKERVDVDELERMGWDYVALGDYHVCHQVGPRMWYSGSLEYTSSDPWSELQKQNELQLSGKGYLIAEFFNDERGSTPAGAPSSAREAAPDDRGAVLVEGREGTGLLAVDGSGEQHGLRRDQYRGLQPEGTSSLVGDPLRADSSRNEGVPSVRHPTVRSSGSSLPGNAEGQHQGRDEQGSFESRGPQVVESANGYRLTFRPIGPTRRFVDLPPIEGTDKTAAELDAEIASRVAETEVDGAVIRLVVREVRRAVKRDLNHAQIRAWQGRALHFQLELRTAESEQSTPTSRAALHKNVDDTVAAFLRGRPLPTDLEKERETFVALGAQYMKYAANAEDPYQ